MKKIFLLFAFSCMTRASYATVLTVYNGTGKSAMYTTFDAAYAAANNGDTIMLYGSTIAYPVGTDITKSLTIIGPGWAPFDNGSGSNTAVISSGNGIYVRAQTAFEGICFANTVYLYTTGASTSFVRCNMNYLNFQEPCDKVIIKGCILLGSAYIEGNNNVISNLIFTNNYVYSGWVIFSQLDNVSNSNIIINHNLFFGGGSLNGGAKMTYTNNIFVNFNANATQCSFQENDFFNCTLPIYVSNNTDAGGNITTSPQMTDQASVDANTNKPVLDFTIQAGSPAKGAAGDGKDMGLLYDAVTVSTDNFANCRLSTLPYVSSAKIINSSVQKGTTIIMNVTANRAF